MAQPCLIPCCVISLCPFLESKPENDSELNNIPLDINASSFDWIYQPGNMYSNSQSGAFRLANGNTLITSANQNDVFEINSSGEIQWSYEGIVGTVRAIKYPIDYLEVDIESIGDLNNDQTINVLDVIELVNMVLSNNYDSNGDLNQDEMVNILDVIALVNIILN